MTLSATERARRKVEREEAKETSARSLGRALSRTGTTQTEVADRLGLAPSKPQRWSDPGSGETMSLADLAVLLRDPRLRGLAVEVLRDVADDAGLAVIEKPTVGAIDAGTVLAAQASRESADVVAAILESHADGELTVDEGERLRREGREMALVGLTVEALGEHVVAERGVRLRVAR